MELQPGSSYFINAVELSLIKAKCRPVAYPKDEENAQPPQKRRKTAPKNITAAKKAIRCMLTYFIGDNLLKYLTAEGDKVKKEFAKVPKSLKQAIYCGYYKINCCTF